MRARYILAAVLLVALSVPASANFYNLPNEVANPNFEGGTFIDWQANGLTVYNQGDWAVPINPNGGSKWAGYVSNWGGNWDAPSGVLRQVIDESQFPGWNPNYNQKELMLDFDYFLKSTGPDTWRDVGLKVWLDWMDPNGAVYPDPAAAGYHRELIGEYWRNGGVAANAWDHASIYKLLPVQPQYLSVEFEFYGHFAEWSFVGLDNIDFEARCVPEPSSLFAMSAGLLGFAGAIRRRR